MTLNDRLTALREHVRAGAENRPGIYRMFGPSGELLYIGKSIQVRTRLLSYFRAERGEKAAEIVGNAHRIDWEYTPSEFAALLAELDSIKRGWPVYNVEHKRERSYCFVKLTRESAPRLMAANEVKPDGALYFGPYAGRNRVREAVREIADLLELRDCATGMRISYADQLEIFARDRPARCLRGELNRCLAPCAGRCTQHEYGERVDLARRFLEGDANRPIAILKSRMETAVDRLQFEYAAQLRDRSIRLQEVSQEMVALRGAIESLTFVYDVKGYKGEDRWYVLRRGTVRAELPAPRNDEERVAVLERAQEILSRTEPPTAELPAHRVAEILLIARWFRLNPAERERTFTLQRGGSARKPRRVRPALPLVIA